MTYGPGVEAMFVIRSDGDTLNGSVITLLDPVGINSTTETATLWVSPNPVAAGGRIHVSGLASPRVRATVRDVHGRRLFDGVIIQGSFNLPHLPSGIYCLVLYDGSTSVTVKLMVE